MARRSIGHFALVALLLLACRRSTPVGAGAAPSASSAKVERCVATKVLTVKRTATVPGTAAGAYQLVTALGSTQGPPLAASLRPDSDDYPAVFDQELAARLEDWASHFWEAFDPAASSMLDGMELAHVPGNVEREVALFGLTPNMLQHPGSQLCGMAYAKSGIEKHIQPSLTFYCYGFRAVDQDRARLADALVFVRGHWALFPRPNDVPKTVYTPGCPPRITTDPTSLVLPPKDPEVVPSPGSAGDARLLLGRMLASDDAAHAELAKLEPSLADVRALYVEPAASRIFNAMKPKWDRVRRGGALLDGETALPMPRDEIVQLHGARPETIGLEDSGCPIGYRSVAAYLQRKAYLYCYTFSAIGLGGIGMDGLAFVRGHWILVPRPWESYPG
jgi:hypothetical protein